MWKESADRMIYGSKSSLAYIFGGFKNIYFVTFSQLPTIFPKDPTHNNLFAKISNFPPTLTLVITSLNRPMEVVFGEFLNKFFSLFLHMQRIPLVVGVNLAITANIWRIACSQAANWRTCANKTLIIVQHVNSLIWQRKTANGYKW